MKKFHTLYLSLLLVSCCSVVQAITVTSVQSGLWSDAATWNCTCVPTASDDVIVHTHTINLGNNDITVDDLTLTGLAQLQNGASITISGNFQLTLGLVYSGNVTVNGNMTWGAGNFYNSGIVNINGMTNLIGYNGLGSGGDKYTTKPFNLNGGANWVEGRLFADNGGSYTLPANQTFTVSFGNGITFPLGGILPPYNGEFNLAGTLNLISGSINVAYLGNFNNQGNLIVQSGAIFNISGNSVFNNTGTLAGNGTYTNSGGTFNQSGAVSPGTSIGTLTLNQLPSGTTTTYIEMQGSTTPGTDYDQIVVNGAGTISGTLNISFLNNYEPTIGNEFIIMTCTGGCSGSFSNIVHPGNNPNAWQVTVLGNEVKLKMEQSLPVELVSLTAHALNENTAYLQWETASELDNDGFFIEKRTDGRSFEDIGFVKGAGNSHQMKTYQYWDDAFRKDAYYRLRQVDFDGEGSYSKIVFLKHGGSSEQGIQVYPNPASDRIAIKSKSTPTPDYAAKMTIENGMGQVVLSLNASPETGWLNIDISHLMPGIYYLKMGSGGIVRFVKQ